MRILVETARFFVGGLFIFSGIIKVNDPVGTAIKLEEYFQVFSYDIAGFFNIFIPAALFLSVLLSVLEVVLGIALIIGFRIKNTIWALLGIIVFFTFLTFYSAYFNKVTDCGCFGDAIKLTPWQSFQKDILLLILIGFLFIKRSDISSFLSPGMSTITVAASAILLTGIAITAIRHLPFIDFRAYSVGNNIPELMLPAGDLIYAYVMEKDGDEYEFDTYPSDKSYTFKELKVLNPEVQPKITDFAVWNDEGEYTDQILLGDKLLFIIYNTETASTKNLEEMLALANDTKRAEAVILTASGYEQFETFRHEHQISIPYYYADATVLKTMVRSNPGIMLLSDGVVVGKWHYNDVPDVSEINKLLN